MVGKWFPETVLGVVYWTVVFEREIAVKHWLQRLQASARAGSYFGWRQDVVFVVRPVEQNGTILLMPREHSVAFYFVPLAILILILGLALGVTR